MNRRQTRTWAAAGAASLLLLAGAAPAQAAAPAPEPPSAPTGCSSTTAEQALQRWGPELPDFAQDGRPELTTSPELHRADTTTYTPCDLSWITVPYSLTGAAPDYPRYALMLFHDGVYLGTATLDPLPFEPSVQRVSAQQLEVDYAYQQDGDRLGLPTGLAQSSFRWDEQTRSVIHDGEFPPGV